MARHSSMNGALESFCAAQLVVVTRMAASSKHRVKEIVVFMGIPDPMAVELSFDNSFDFPKGDFKVFLVTGKTNV